MMLQQRPIAVCQFCDISGPLSSAPPFLPSPSRWCQLCFPQIVVTSVTFPSLHHPSSNRSCMPLWEWCIGRSSSPPIRVDSLPFVCMAKRINTIIIRLKVPSFRSRKCLCTLLSVSFQVSHSQVRRNASHPTGLSYLYRKACHSMIPKSNCSLVTGFTPHCIFFLILICRELWLPLLLTRSTKLAEGCQEYKLADVAKIGRTAGARMQCLCFLVRQQELTYKLFVWRFSTL